MAQINGQEVPVLNIRGKEYPTVATRVQVAHLGGLGSGFSMIDNEIVSVHDRDFLKITIQIGDNRFSGSAEIHWNATGNNADATAPLETAETSALGRALAFAGFIIDSIASADEMQRVTVEAEAPRQIKPAPAAPKIVHKALPEPKAKVPTVGDQCVNLAKDLHFTRSDWNALVTLHTHSDKTDWEAMKAALMAQVEEKAAS